MNIINAPAITCFQADDLFPHDEDLNPLPVDPLAHKCLEELIGPTDPASVTWEVLDMNQPMKYRDETRQEAEAARAIVGDKIIIFWYQC